MVKRLKRVSPLQAGKVIGALYALLSLVVIPFFILGFVVAAFAPNSNGNMMPAAIGLVSAVFMVVLLPIMYGVLGFIFGALGALAYNLIAGWMGGLEFEVE
jgi:hypothetical protein